jgi:hypothetical protein
LFGQYRRLLRGNNTFDGATRPDSAGSSESYQQEIGRLKNMSVSRPKTVSECLDKESNKNLLFVLLRCVLDSQPKAIAKGAPTTIIPAKQVKPIQKSKGEENKTQASEMTVG